MPSPVRFAVVRKMLEAKGYSLHRINGSHHIFKHRDGSHYTLPVHGGKVKPYYVKDIKNLKSD